MPVGVLIDRINTPSSMDQVFKDILIWLKFNGVSVIEEEEPRHIKGHWKGNIVGSDGERTGREETETYIDQTEAKVPFTYDLINDPFPKNIEVNITQRNSGSSVDFVIQQAESRHRDKGLVYWGLKLEELYERLGVDVKQVNLENLYGARVKDEVDKLVRQYLLLFLVSLVVVLFVFGLLLDILLTYVFIFVIPLTYFYGVRYKTYKEIKDRLR